MNTKYALFALCLPFAFASCQNEEIIKSPAVDLESRGQIDVVVSAKNPGMVESRMTATESGNALTFLWEKDTDVLGAALMDGVEAGTVDNTTVYANYPFIAQNSGASAQFASPSSITQGIYMFYNSYVDVLNRKALKLYLPDQVYDATLTKTPAQQMVDYMNMVAPLVNLSSGIKLADADEFVLPLEFVNLYTPIKVPVVFKNAPEGTTLDKITINTTGDFIKGGRIDADVINKAGVLTLKNGAINDENLSVADAVEALDEQIQSAANNSNLYLAEGSTAVTKGAATLTLKNGVAMTNGVAKEFWVLIPRGQYADLKVQVYTSNGVMEVKTIEIKETLEDYPNAKPRLFTSETRSLSNVEVVFGDGGNVGQPTEFTIASTADFDNAVAYVDEHITSYLGKDVVFSIPNNKTVYVSTLPKWGFSLKNGSTKSYFVLGKADGSALNLSVSSQIKNGGNGQLTIGTGATVAINDNVAAAVTNNGTLNYNIQVVTGSVTNYGTMNILKTGSSVTGGLINYGTVNVKADATLTGVYNSGADVNADGVKETFGTVNVEADAALILKADNSSNVAKATIVNKGVTEIATALTNGGTIDNYGTLKVTAALTNNGTIVARNESKSSGTSAEQITGGTVEVVNPVYWAELNENSATKYNLSGSTVNALVSDRKSFLAAKATTGMNITLDNATWNIVADGSSVTDSSRDLMVADFAEVSPIPAITAINVKGGLNVKVNADLSTVAVTTAGTATLSTAKKTSLSVKTLTIPYGTSLTISDSSVLSVEAAELTDVLVNGKLAIEEGAKLITPEVETVAAPSGFGDLNVSVVGYGEMTIAKNSLVGGEMNTVATIVVGDTDRKAKFTNTQGAVRGSVDISNAASGTIGSVTAYPSKVTTSAIDLTVFADKKGVSNIVATEDVTTIPAGINIEFKEGAPDITLAAGTVKYGNLTFNEDATITGVAGAPAINGINFAVADLTLTLVGDVNVACASVSGKNAEVTATGAAKLVNTAGTPAEWNYVSNAWKAE